MTIEEKLVEMLIENGMFDTQAKEVMELIKSDEANETMQGRWRDAPGDYPEVMLAVLWLSTRIKALEWIDENVPQAWYRPMFVEENERDRR